MVDCRFHYQCNYGGFAKVTAASLCSDLLPGCVIDQIEQGDKMWTISAHGTCASAMCPGCGQTSIGVHSYYTRSPRDLPLGGKAVCIGLRVRRFRCRNPICARQTFAEPVPELLARHARRTRRLTGTLQEVGFAVGGEAGTRLLGHMQMATSARTLLRLLRGTSESPSTAVRVLGVDDWAIRKGQTYGTILVDLEQHRPIDLLSDRSATTLAVWLRDHPEIEIIARDRSTEYARGASEGAPSALQVADRWHLLQNLTQMVERLMNRLYGTLKQLPSVDEDMPAAGSIDPLPRTRLRLDPKDREAIASSLARSHATYQQVQELRRAGCSIRQIAGQLSMSRVTVRNYFYAETFPHRAQRKKSQSMLDAYLPYLESRHQAGCEDAKQLWRELCEQGYSGAYSQVRRWMQQRRQTIAPTTPKRHREAVVSAIRERDAGRSRQVNPKALPSYKKLAWLLIQEPETLAPEETATLRRICQNAQVDRTYPLVQQFRTMVRQHESAMLDPWLDACAASNIPDLVTFAASIRQDHAAVCAALKMNWSNGQTEGQVNRLKCLKRQMYGRAKFDLLRLRVLHPH
jgi:transposase